MIVLPNASAMRSMALRVHFALDSRAIARSSADDMRAGFQR
jgi:hypothetical protein